MSRYKFKRKSKTGRFIEWSGIFKSYGAMLDWSKRNMKFHIDQGNELFLFKETEGGTFLQVGENSGI